MIFIVHISIPYGAIKREQLNIKQIIKVLFQFLMVRLKVVYQLHFGLCYSISIPYGAIKRFEYQCTGALPRRFQFLMVRLKEKKYE